MLGWCWVSSVCCWDGLHLLQSDRTGPGCDETNPAMQTTDLLSYLIYYAYFLVYYSLKRSQINLDPLDRNQNLVQRHKKYIYIISWTSELNSWLWGKTHWNLKGAPANSSQVCVNTDVNIDGTSPLKYLKGSQNQLFRLSGSPGKWLDRDRPLADLWGRWSVWNIVCLLLNPERHGDLRPRPRL